MKGYGSIYALLSVLAERERFGSWPGGEDYVFAATGEGTIGLMHAIELDIFPFDDML